MAHKQKGLLTPSPQWAVHLRKYWKRVFWKGERQAVKEIIQGDTKELPPKCPDCGAYDLQYQSDFDYIDHWQCLSCRNVFDLEEIKWP